MKNFFTTIALSTSLMIFSSAKSVGDEALSAATSGGSFWVQLEPSKFPIPLNEIISIEIHVFHNDERCKPIEGAKMTANAKMPAHKHGMNLEPRISIHDDGSTTGNGFLFHMEGRWEILVGVVSDGQMEQARIPIDITP